MPIRTIPSTPRKVPPDPAQQLRPEPRLFHKYSPRDVHGDNDAGAGHFAGELDLLAIVGIVVDVVVKRVRVLEGGVSAAAGVGGSGGGRYKGPCSHRC